MEKVYEVWSVIFVLDIIILMHDDLISLLVNYKIMFKETKAQKVSSNTSWSLLEVIFGIVFSCLQFFGFH